jgi:hypothetical protein
MADFDVSVSQMACPASLGLPRTEALDLRPKGRNGRTTSREAANADVPEQGSEYSGVVEAALVRDVVRN